LPDISRRGPSCVRQSYSFNLQDAQTSFQPRLLDPPGNERTLPGLVMGAPGFELHPLLLDMGIPRVEPDPLGMEVDPLGVKLGPPSLEWKALDLKQDLLGVK
jgi:hypothetical protein